jgi:hypothetical protein
VSYPAGVQSVEDVGRNNPCQPAMWRADNRHAFGPTCPITARLRHWLLTHPMGPSGCGPGACPPPNVLGFDPICRCQQARGVLFRQFRLQFNNGHLARVLGLPRGLTFVVLHSADGWRVDDIYCAGRPKTTLYAPPPWTRAWGCPTRIAR